MVSPTLGLGWSTVFISCRSACCGVSVALAVLLPVLGSGWSLWLIVAVLVAVAALATVAVRVRVCGVPGLTVPAVQTPVVLLYVPWLGLAETKVSPAGSRSVTCTPVAVDGPLL